MGSRRVYITLNDEKEKDRIIEAYLSQSYSEADAIKEALYRLATDNIQQVKKNTKRTIKDKKDTKSNKEVQKGTINTDKDEKVTNVKGDNKEIKDINSTHSVQPMPLNDNKVDIVSKDTSEELKDNNDFVLDLSQLSDEPVVMSPQDNKSEELKQKKVNALRQFM